VTRVDPNRIGALLRSIAREELIPRHRALVDHEIFSKATEWDPEEVVTAADLAIERRLTDELSSMLPGSIVVGEESASASPNSVAGIGSDAPVWIIDPLDGTRNFVAGLDTFASMLALARAGTTLMAWIYLPTEDALFVAEAGAGAFRNGHRLRTMASVTGPHSGTIYVRYMPADLRGRLDARAKDGLHLLPIAASAAIEYTRLAQGQQDFAVFFRLLPWDHVPGALLLTEAGGAVRGLDEAAYGPGTGNQPMLLVRHESMWRDLRRVLFD
jgi:fructose-1,6-bisphosphatase/inositol monophosphatase family enzyme